MKNVKFRSISPEKDEFRGKFRGSNPRKKPKIRGSTRNSTGAENCGP